MRVGSSPALEARIKSMEGFFLDNLVEAVDAVIVLLQAEDLLLEQLLFLLLQAGASSKGLILSLKPFILAFALFVELLCVFQVSLQSLAFSV